MNVIIDINFDEADIFEKEKISFHIPHSKKLDDNHQYLKKRIVWTLVEYKNTENFPNKEIEEDKKNGIRYHEIPIQIVTEINGITNKFIKEKINSKDCFSFHYLPNELDTLTLRSDYEYKEIKAISQPYSRILEYIAFTFKNGTWEISEKIENRVIKRSRIGILKIITN